MPSYYVHFATCGKDSLKNRSFVLGVEAPDILKKYVKVYGGIQGAHDKYDSLRTNEMPNFAELQTRVLQKERADSNEGLHYGLSSNPDVWACWLNLSEKQKINPFYRGYVWHLLTDVLIYARLNIDAKFQEFLKKDEGNPDIEELRKVEVKKPHADWDKTNALIRDTYPDITLPDEVKELGVVQFIDEGNLVYVDWHILKETIDYLKNFDPLNGDMYCIIENILKNI